MKTIRGLLLAAFLFSIPAFAQAQQAPSLSLGDVQVYGHGAYLTSIGSQDDGLLWARFGAKAMPAPYLQTVFEYDLAGQDLVYAYGRFFLNIADRDFSLIFGQYRDPIRQLYPDYGELSTTRWPTLANTHNETPQGVALWVEEDNKAFKASFSSESDQSFTATYENFSAFWETWGEGNRGGLQYQQETDSKWFSPLAGISYNNEDEVWFTAQNVISPMLGVGVYTQVDYYKDELSYLTGLSLEYSPRSFIKFFYDDMIHSGVLQLTFGF